VEDHQHKQEVTIAVIHIGRRNYQQQEKTMKNVLLAAERGGSRSGNHIDYIAWLFCHASSVVGCAAGGTRTAIGILSKISAK
jgi:hypothetical protein